MKPLRAQRGETAGARDALDRDEGRQVGTALEAQHEVRAFEPQHRPQLHVERVELHVAVQAQRQPALDLVAQARLGFARRPHAERDRQPAAQQRQQAKRDSPLLHCRHVLPAGRAPEDYSKWPARPPMVPSAPSSTGFPRWLAGLEARHLRDMTTTEVARALRALSSTYVERRSRLSDRGAFDTAGKRAAYALYYAPRRFLTVAHVLAAVGAPALPLHVVDLGCGTGAAGAAWAGHAGAGIERACRGRAPVGARRSACHPARFRPARPDPARGGRCRPGALEGTRAAAARGHGPPASCSATW